jgi:hypothetical protein
VSDHILSRSLPDPQAVRLLLKCLNHLRSQQLDALKCSAPPADGIKNPAKWPKVGALPLAALVLIAAAHAIAKLRAAAPSEATPAFLLHPASLKYAGVPVQVYWLDLDYLQVAQAAVQVCTVFR